MPPTPRVATCGRWISGGLCSPPKVAVFGCARPALHLVRPQGQGSRAGGEILDRPAPPEQVLLAGVLEHRHDQAAIERYCDAQVDVVRADDDVAAEPALRMGTGTRGRRTRARSAQ